MRFRSALLLCAAFSILSLSGCNHHSTVGSVQGVAIGGRVFGGNQPVTGSTIQLYAAGTGGTGSAATALISAVVTTSDGTGLVNSNANAGNANNGLTAGFFTISGDYTCPTVDTQVYLTAVGGNPGIGSNNPNISVMVALGSCGYLSNSTNVTVNEVTTVGTLAGIYPYTNGYASVGSSSANATGLAEEFSAATEYMDPGAGVTPGPSLPANYYGSSNEINTLADAVATCINSSGGSATNGTSDGSACGNLFAAATVGNGVSPTDTVGAVLNILQNPTNNVGTIFNLVPANSPFQPTLTAAPSDWTLTLVPLPQAPFASPATGTYAQAQQVTLTTPTNGATIYYTLDGSSPTVKSNSYTGPVTVSSTATLKAIAVNRAGASTAAANAYTIAGAAAAPVISLAGGSYSTPQTYTVSSATADAAIYITLDGTTPTSSSTLVTGPLQLQMSQTVKAIAIAGSLSSGVTSAVYTYAPGSQTIDTLVGSGGKVGDNIPAVAATLNSPFGVAVDTSGNVYIADTTDYRIRKIAAQTGIITTIAGTGTTGFSGDNGPATNAAIGVVHQIAVDGSGNLYLTDATNSRIRMVAAGTGTITTVAGSGSGTFSGDKGQAKLAGVPSPYGLAVDGSGNLYIGTYGDARVRKVTASTGVITTIAGNGTAGFTGDNGLATSAEIGRPYGVAVDASGNVFVADSTTYRVRKVTASTGIITTFAGTGTQGSGGDGGAATSATLGAVYGVSLDVNGNVYLADYSNYRVRKVTAATGLISTVAGTGTSGYVATQDGGSATSAQLTSPRAVATDVNGNLLIADGNRVREVTAAGIISTIGGNGTTAYGTYTPDGLPGLQTALTSPNALAKDAAGNLYFTDAGSNRVRKLAVGTGIVTTVAGTGVSGNTGDGGPATSATLYAPTSLALDAAGNLYIADTNNRRIRKVTMSTGTITAFAGTGAIGSTDGPALSATFNYPRGIAFDAAGNLYIADYENYTVRVLRASTGAVSVFAGMTGSGGHSGDGGPATSATLGAVFSVAVDASGGVYIADGGYNMVRKVTGGIISTVAGVGGASFSGDGGPATSAYFNQLFGVAVDTSGNLYIADTGNQRVRKVTGGIVNTIVGNATAGYVASQDGGPAASAELKGPNGLLVDANGTLYIADTGNARIRVVYP